VSTNIHHPDADDDQDRAVDVAPLPIHNDHAGLDTGLDAGLGTGPAVTPDADDDLGQPIPVELADPNGHPSHDRAGDQHRDRLRLTTRARRRRPSLWLATYTTACLGSLWLLGLALVHANVLIMLLMTGALFWLGPTTGRLARRLDRRNTGQWALWLPRPQRLAAALLALLYLYLAIDWLAWTLHH